MMQNKKQNQKTHKENGDISSSETTWCPHSALLPMGHTDTHDTLS